MSSLGGGREGGGEVALLNLCGTSTMIANLTHRKPTQDKHQGLLKRAYIDKEEPVFN